MKKTNKKGFTLVELVIVIAVIAILAAVLIPTFATVIEKGKKSARLQTAQNALKMVLAEEDDASLPKDSIIKVEADGKTVYFVYDGSSLGEEKTTGVTVPTSNYYTYSKEASTAANVTPANIQIAEMASGVTVYVLIPATSLGF